jgi:hypothetical protein
MRKQDRIAQEQSRSTQSDDKPQPSSSQKEQVRGSAASDQPSRPPRAPDGKLPLPE